MTAAVDPQQPWLGLDSFSEATRSFFYGREEEIAELARRVQRKPLTVLFGQSGLGKTSILRAGLVPRLRPEGYCPVYVRLDYARESPPPAEQIKLSIFRETLASGTWTQTGAAVQGESLWEFLHHRDDMLRDADGRALTPLLIFDQFEEIFTLAQSDDFGRARAAQFIAELADLVENRPPRSLEARLDEDDTIAERFDFARCDYRILVSLREDYLAHLEALKAAMPSITQNRMRLARMTGQQALDAVIKPGGALVSQEVAEAIVRFVAGGAELRNAEVEPSLLSLICRELNTARIAQGRSEISADLLAGSHATILAEFYQRALADQPPGVHRFIEEELLTDSGFRENVAQERVQKAFTEVGASADALSRLVDRRLLRVEERLDVRRVELTHDVLCSVVRASRDTRHDREARDEAERQLALQRERETATRQALRRARRIATACAALAIVAVGAAAFGIYGMHHAQRTQEMAEAARGESERLIVYLLDDFHRELEPVGRLDIVGELAKRALDYYKGLPQALQTAATERNRALAQVRWGAVLRNQGRTEQAGPLLDDAVATLRAMREGGDVSEPTTVGLALGLSARARTYDAQGSDSQVLMPAQQAADVLAPVAGAPQASTGARRAYGAVLIQLGFVQMRQALLQPAVIALEDAREVWRSIDGLKDDADAGANYAIASAWLVEALGRMGRDDEARRAGNDGRRAATLVLERNPTHMLALRGRALITSGLAEIEDRQFRLAQAQALAEAARADWALVTRIDPSNVIAWNNWAGSGFQAMGAVWKQGRVREAVEHLRGTRTQLEPVVGAASMLAGQVLENAFQQAWALSDLGERSAADAAWRQREKYLPIAYARLQAGSFELESRLCFDQARLAHLNRLQQRWAAALEHGAAALACADKLPQPSELAKLAVIDIRRIALVPMAHTALEQGAASAAEKHLRAAVEAARGVPQDMLNEQQTSADEQALLAIALARQGRLDDARAFAQPALAVQRRLQAMPGNSDIFQRAQYATALYAAALAEPAGVSSPRAPLLAEARKVYDSLCGECRGLSSIAWLAPLLAQAHN
jgi:hypothetical protein